MKLRMSCAAIAAITVLAGPAAAADLGGNCCADLEERIAELEATTARKGNRKVKLEISGQVNESLLWWDDAGETNIYQGTNDTARTRFRFKGEAKINDDWKAGYLLEIGVRANRLSRTDETTDEGTDGGLDVRHSAWWIENKDYGRLWIGQTSQATDAVTEVNLANMNHFARLSASKWNMSNHIIVNGVRSTDRRWRDLLPADGNTGDNVPGEGDRASLVKWVSPKVKGFEVSAAWGEDDFWDVALRYHGEFSGFKLAAAIGYGEFTDANIGDVSGVQAKESLRGCAQPGVAHGNLGNASSDSDCNALGGSISVMHESTGLFVTAGAGVKDDNLRDELFGNRATPISPIDNQDWFWGIQAGIEKKVFDLGKTTLYGEFAHFEAGAQIEDEAGGIRSFNSAFPNLGGGAADNFSTGSLVEFWGFGINQHVEKAAMDFYLGYRHHEGELTLSSRANPGIRQKFAVEDIDMIMTGAMIKF